ncbi:MAG: DUF5131 family protein [Pseudomonadota bacterium]
MNPTYWYGANVLAWNPLAMLCAPVSAGCANCWHCQSAARLATNERFSADERAAWAGKGPPVLRMKQLAAPLRRRKRTVICVQFMGDIFHESVSTCAASVVIGMASLCGRHTFLLLTKRPDRLAEFFRSVSLAECQSALYDLPGWSAGTPTGIGRIGDMSSINGTNDSLDGPDSWPVPNVIIGVSASTQADVDRLVPQLLAVPAAKRWLSLEPLLEAIDLSAFVGGPYVGVPLDWVVVGAETGPGARPMQADWARNIRDRCTASGVRFYVKQMDKTGWRPLDGQLWNETLWHRGE